MKPPTARREEDRVVWVGAAPPGWDPAIPRQSETSTEPLVDPPVGIPDPYGWLRDDERTNEEVMAHLKAETDHAEHLTAHLKDLRTTLYDELLSYVQETDYTTPRPKHDGYLYYTRTFQGKSYRVYCRAPRHGQESTTPTWDGTAESPVLKDEQVTLDLNVLAEGKPYCGTGSVTTSPSSRWLAYAADFTGDEVCHLFVKDLETGTTVSDDSLEISGRIVWGKDDSTLFYLKQNKAKRPFQLFRRRVENGQFVGEEEMLFQELNEVYYVGAYKSLDGRYLFVETSSFESTEIYYLDLDDPSATLQCIAKRRDKVLYEVEHRNGQFWISSNVGGRPNFALFTAPVQPEAEWTLVQHEGEPVFAGSEDCSLDNVECFSNHVVASGWQGGLPQVWILSVDGNVVTKVGRLTFDESPYDVGVGTHHEFDVDQVMISFDSMVTPPSSLLVNMNDPTQRTIVKQTNVPGYDQSLYASRRTFVTSRDGSTKIPVSMVYRKDVMEQRKNLPCYLYGYGSYGSCVETDFVKTRLPLLNRGMVCVVAHVRGGGEMGRIWYEEPKGAKMLCKKNTFNDFVDVAQWLIDEEYTTPQRLACGGRSAGGMLIGASVNQAPHLFKVALLGVPFVDVLGTMVDASIPLTAGEWDEWGNPNEKKYFEYIKEYSPVHNVKEGATYPTCLFTCGFHDPRVAYWEPAKFTAQLRHTIAADSGPIVLKVDLSSGHFSASDRYKYLRELAWDQAFMLDQLGLVDN